MMNPSQEVTALRKAGKLDEAHSKGYELLKENPEDQFIASSIGWVLYDQIKLLVEQANQSKFAAIDALSGQLRLILREYAALPLSRPDLLFSLLLSQTLRFPQQLEFLPAFVKWAGLTSFRPEDYQAQRGQDNRVFESLVEKTAREVGKVARSLQEISHLKEFSIKLIDHTLKQAEVQKPEWLYYNKALLLAQLQQSEKAIKILIPFVQKKRNDFWVWHALAKVVGNSDPQLALALCAKACLTCNDPKYGVSTFEDLSKLAANQGNTALAKWAADQAFTVRNQNQWKIPQSLRDLLNSSWYSHADHLINPQDTLANIAADAEKVIWANCPQYPANYLDTFKSKSGKNMVKFGLVYRGVCQEVVSPVAALLNNLSLVQGEPVIVTIDNSSDRLNVVGVEKRNSGQPFDQLERIYGILSGHQPEKAFVYINPDQQSILKYIDFPEIKVLSLGTAIQIICARHGERINPYQICESTWVENQNISQRSGNFQFHQNGFGFVEDVFVPPHLASQLKDGQQTSCIVVKKLDKKKNRLGWTAIALLDQPPF